MAEWDLEEMSHSELVAALRSLRDENRTLLAEIDQRQASWSRFARIHDGAPVALLMLDHRGVVHMSNQAAADLLRYDQGRMIGKPFIVVARLRDPAPFWRHLQQCFERPEAVSTEIEVVFAAGDWRAVQVMSRRFRDPTLGWVAVTALIDLQDRIQYQREVERAHEEEQRLRARLEAQVRAGTAIGEAQAEMYRYGFESVLQAIAEQACHLVDGDWGAVGIGGTPGEAFEHWVATGVGDADGVAAPPRRAGVLDEMASGSVVRIEDPARLATLDWPVRARGLVGVPIRHGDRVNGGLFVINKRTAAGFDADDERALALLAEHAALVVDAALATDEVVKERARLQRILDQLPEAVLVMDAHARLIPNRKALELSVDGGGLVDPFGNPVRWDIRFPDGRPAAFDEIPLVRAFRERRAFTNVEMALMIAKDRCIPILTDASPIEDEQGASLGAVVVWRDIEHLKALEQMRQEWSAVVAHDLRQALSIIKLSDQILTSATAPENENALRAMSAIEKAVGRMGEMLDDLIDTSLVETHRVTLHKTPVLLADLIRETVESVGTGGHPVRLALEPDLPVLELDAGRIERVLENLLSNAYKYGAAGTEVVVEAARRGGEVEVSVTNLGEELSSEEVRRLFSRFYRAPSSRRKNGLGLGLYIAQGFVEAHGGRIWCEAGDRRMTFHFTLPTPASLERVQPHA